MTIKSEASADNDPTLSGFIKDSKAAKAGVSNVERSPTRAKASVGATHHSVNRRANAGDAKSNVDYKKSDLNTGDGDNSSYTVGDLLAGLAEWQVDADLLCCIAEDLPEDALRDACHLLFGDDGLKMERLIADVVHCGDNGDSDAFDRALEAAQLAREMS